MANPPKEQLELIVVKEEPAELDSVDTEQHGTNEHSEYHMNVWPTAVF